MANIEKSPREMVAQFKEALPYYCGFNMPKEESVRLQGKSDIFKKAIDSIDTSKYSDEELAQQLSEIESTLAERAILDPSEGEGAEDRIAYNTDEKKRLFHYSDEQANLEALKSIKQSGYISAIRFNRRNLEKEYSAPTSEFIKEHPLDASIEKAEIESVIKGTIDISTISPEEQRKLQESFPTGNYIFHSANTGSIVKILESGKILSTEALFEKEKKDAAEEGREQREIKWNSGSEGISWNMNGIDAMPSDRYHIAGFLTAPETILKDSEQFTIPSRPAPNEVIQITSEIDAKRFYEAKTQYELYNVFKEGESNSVYSNISALKIWENEDLRELLDEPMLLRAKRELLSKPDYKEKLRAEYQIDENGITKLNPDLLQQKTNEIPVAAVWIQAAIDTGKLIGTPFEGKELPEIIDLIDDDNRIYLLSPIRKDWNHSKDIIDAEGDGAESIKDKIDNMYFVCARKDFKKWAKIIARCENKPIGVLLYDDKKVRLENFASPVKGDNQELTNEIGQVITPNEGFIDYSEVLGKKEFTRAGYRNQVISESDLVNRKTIKKVDGKLVVS